MLAVLYGAGMWRSEVAALKLEDLGQEIGVIVTRAEKGRKWLELRGNTPSVLNKGGSIIRPMTDQSIFHVLNKG